MHWQASPSYQNKPSKDLDGLIITTELGDLVQLGTLDVRPLPEVVLEHFTARDIISRLDAVDIYSRVMASAACHYLDKIQERMPFPVRAI